MWIFGKRGKNHPKPKDSSKNPKTKRTFASSLWIKFSTQGKGTFEKASGSTDYLSADASDKFTNTTDGVAVNVYLFFNGEDATCTIANLQEAIAATENNYQVEVSFTVQ